VSPSLLDLMRLRHTIKHQNRTSPQWRCGSCIAITMEMPRDVCLSLFRILNEIFRECRDSQQMPGFRCDFGWFAEQGAAHGARFRPWILEELSRNKGRDRTEQHEGTRGLLKGTLSITSSPRGGTEPKVPKFSFPSPIATPRSLGNLSINQSEYG
jgi:hypothetical protein